MNLWRLIPHHRDKADAYRDFLATGRIAIGWSELGDLRLSTASSVEDLRDLIKAAMPELQNAPLGGLSLWNFWRGMQPGDLVLVPYGKGRAVFEVTGEYEFLEESSRVAGYGHVRAAELTGIDGEQFWADIGAAISSGQNPQLTAARCEYTAQAIRSVYLEGARYSLTSTAAERNPRARAACIEHHGHRCAACEFDFEERYGDIGAGYIHVHHLIPLASRAGQHAIDPINELVPLCANCHAMVHTENPPIAIDRLKQRLLAGSAVN